MRRIQAYLFFLGLLLLAGSLFSSCSPEKNEGPNLRESYSKNDNNPFGASIAYRQVKALYKRNKVRDIRQSFAKTWKEVTDTGSLYICITRFLYLNEEEVNAMLQYVSEGNDLFIAAASIDDLLLEKINCGTRLSLDIFLDPGFLSQTDTRSLIEPDSAWSYFYLPFGNHFNRIDTGYTRIVGLNQKKLPNSIVYFYGRGKLFLHCDPRAFSNYFLLKNQNYRYLEQSLGFTAEVPQRVYWDDYYNKLRRRSSENFSTFSEIMKHPPLKYAFWITLGLLLLYVLFGGKRVQRIVELRKPNENTTVTFTETIGRLYLQKKDNRNIADKMITYFNEFIRNKYFLNTNQVNDEFITSLGRKSGVPREQVESLFRVIADVQSADELDDYRLLSLNEQILNFHKNKN